MWWCWWCYLPKYIYITAEVDTTLTPKMLGCCVKLWCYNVLIPSGNQPCFFLTESSTKTLYFLFCKYTCFESNAAHCKNNMATGLRALPKSVTGKHCLFASYCITFSIYFFNLFGL